MNDEKKEPFPVTEGIIVAAIPLLGYLLVFSFEFGFANYFRMPIEFISVSFTSLCLVSLLLISSLLFLFMVGHFLTFLFTFILEPRVPAVIKRAFRRILIYALIGVLPNLICWGRDWKEYGLSLYWFLFLMAMEFGWPLLTQIKQKGYIAKMEAQEKIELHFEPQQRRFFDWADGFFGRKIVIVFVLVSIVLFNTYHCGYARAKKRETFLSLSGSGDRIVLRIYGENAVSVGLNRQKKELDGRFELTKLNDSVPKRLFYEPVGRLKK